MKTADEWFAKYGESHQHPTNKLIHWICVPAIVFSLIGLLWSIPRPEFFAGISPWLNWGTLFIALAMVYYAVLSLPLALGMIVVSGVVIWGNAWLAQLETPLWQVALAIFVVAWIGQFIGHRIEGKKPSFFEDIQFLLIGPIWLLGFIYRKAGLPY
ncbi:MAG: Mpo1-like protein [Gammaproteobacteria bacterium]|nr:Mpo1-like protein [Gammaproteobacteria bacterium]